MKLKAKPSPVVHNLAGESLSRPLSRKKMELEVLKLLMGVWGAAVDASEATDLSLLEFLHGVLEVTRSLLLSHRHPQSQPCPSLPQSRRWKNGLRGRCAKNVIRRTTTLIVLLPPVFIWSFTKLLGGFRIKPYFEWCHRFTRDEPIMICTCTLPNIAS